MIRNITDKGLFLLLILVTLSSCKRQNMDTPEPPPTPQESEEIQLPLIKLETPIVLEIGATQPTAIIEGSPSSASTRSFSRDYTSTDRQHASVNTTNKDKVNTGNAKLDQLIKDNWFWLEGYDYINTLIIPELPESEYKVEGLVPRKFADSSGEAEVPGAIDSTQPIPSKVTITLYSIPNDGTLTFLANARVYQSYYYRGQNVGSLDLNNPYLVTMSPFWQLSDKVRDEFKQSGSGYHLGNNSSSLFEGDYIPMYGRIFHTEINSNGDGLMASESETGTQVEMKTIYLERAISFVGVTWEHEMSSNDLKPYKGWWYYSGEYVIEQVHHGLYCNICSILPNNWEGVKSHASTHTKYRVPKSQADGSIAFYRHILDGDIMDTQSASIKMTLMRRARQGFFVPENFPTKKEDQNTLYVQLSRFRSFEDPNNPTEFAYEFVGERNQFKFDLPYGERNSSSGFYDIHRNTFYHLHLKIKETPRGPVVHMAQDWKEVDIPTEL